MDNRPIDHIALRRLAANTWEVSVRMSVHHLSEAEKPNQDLSTEDDMFPVQMAEGRRQSHLRLAEAYARLAQACHKVPGSQF